MKRAGRTLEDAPGSSGVYDDTDKDLRSRWTMRRLISYASLQAIQQEIDSRPRQEEQDIFL